MALTTYEMNKNEIKKEIKITAQEIGIARNIKTVHQNKNQVQYNTSIDAARTERSPCFLGGSVEFPFRSAEAVL